MSHCRVAVEDGAEHDSLFFLSRKPMYNAIVAPFYTLLPHREGSHSRWSQKL